MALLIWLNTQIYLSIMKINRNFFCNILLCRNQNIKLFLMEWVTSKPNAISATF